MKRIYILTNFSMYLKSYSPMIVVSEQLKMLRNQGYEPTLIVTEGFDPPEGSLWHDFRMERVPTVPVSNEAAMDATFELDVEKLKQRIGEIIEDDSVVITHDLIFLPDYVKHNVACRAIAKDRGSIQWLHWIHSATSPRGLIQERNMYGDKYVELLSEKFPNSSVVFPNAYDKPRVAKNFGFELNEVFEVPHSTDPVDGMQPIVRRLYKEARLGEADAIMVYPLRLDRGKNAEVNIEIMAQCKNIGLNVRMIYADFHSTGGDKEIYREELKRLATEKGLGEDCIFLSEFDEAARLESSRQVVLDLFQLSNVFCLPSKSETYSLVAQEAMSRGNLCILNHDFAPMRQIYGDNAVYKQFSANIGFDGLDGQIDTKYGDGGVEHRDLYMRDIALLIEYYLIHDKVLAAKTWVRKERNPDATFKKYLEPLFYKE